MEKLKKRKAKTYLFFTRFSHSQGFAGLIYETRMDRQRLRMQKVVLSGTERLFLNIHETRHINLRLVHFDLTSFTSLKNKYLEKDFMQKNVILRLFIVWHRQIAMRVTDESSESSSSMRFSCGDLLTRPVRAPQLEFHILSFSPWKSPASRRGLWWFARAHIVNRKSSRSSAPAVFRFSCSSPSVQHSIFSALRPAETRAVRFLSRGRKVFAPEVHCEDLKVVKFWHFYVISSS